MKRILFVIAVATLALLIPAGGMTTDQTYVAASILRGEAPEDCEKCRAITACALVSDIESGVTLRRRWYGWRDAREQDIRLIERAESDVQFCRCYPECRFVGNGRDLEVWARKGWVSESVQTIAYCSDQGCTVCVPAIPPAIKAE